jgi:hypothetical protein
MNVKYGQESTTMRIRSEGDSNEGRHELNVRQRKRHNESLEFNSLQFTGGRHPAKGEHKQCLQLVNQVKQ